LTNDNIGAGGKDSTMKVTVPGIHQDEIGMGELDDER
jgi:hypothetical protein